MAVSIVIDVTQNSQSVANNTSNVTVKVNAKWTGGSYNLLEKSGYCIIDGTKYTFTSPFNTVRTTSGSCNLYTKTLNIAHGSDGAKTLAVSASYTSGVSSGTVAASASVPLATIPRKSTLSVANGTLGTSQTLTITRQSTGFTHSIKAVCGNSALYIKADGSTQSSESVHNDTSIPFTPPLSWASQNTSGESVNVTYTITTYTTGPAKVATETYSAKYTIPDSVKPSCSITIEDVGTMLGSKHLQGMAQFKITVKPTTSYGSAIKSYKTVVNGKTYTSASFTTDVINKAEDISITSTVTDKRERSGSCTQTVTITPYHKPVFEIANAHRARMTGDGPVLDHQGNFIYVTVAASASYLSGLNSAVFQIDYKKATDSQYTTLQTVTIPAESMELWSSGFAFQADTSSSYDIRLVLFDAVSTIENPTTRIIPVSTAAVFMSWHSPDGSNNYDGIAFGKVAEESDLLDIGFRTRFYGGILPVVLEPGTDLDTVLLPNTYTGDNTASNNYTNCPVSSGTFTLLVESCGESGQVKQTYVSCSKYKPERFSRFYYQGEWGAWFWANTDEHILYENETGAAGAVTLAAAASHYRYIEIYFTDNNAKAGGYTKVWNPNGKSVCLQITEPSSSVYSRQTLYTISGTSLTPDTTNASYFRVNSNNTITTSFGTNYIRIIRVIGRA